MANPVLVTDYGAVGDGVTDNSAAFTAAFAASECVIVPMGTFVANVIIPNGGMLVGQHQHLSIVMAKAAANSTVIAGLDAYALFGSSTLDTSQGANNVVIRNLTVDGNRANVTESGDGIAIWGYGITIENVCVRNCRSIGIHTEWTDGDVSMEGHFSHIVIDTVGSHGWSFCGPHDSNFQDIIIIDASQNSDSGNYGIYIGSGGGASGANGRFFNLHVWHRSGITNRCAFAAYSTGGGNQFTACHFEGCRRLLWLEGGDQVANSLFYSYFGPNGGAMLNFGGSNDTIVGCSFQSSEGSPNPNDSINPNPDVFAVNFGSTAGNTLSACQFMGFSSRSPFDFATSGGWNVVSASIGWAASGGATSFGGAVNSSDIIDYVQGGAYINYRKPAVYESFANDAAAASGGVPLGGLYLNTSIGALSPRRT
jgi:hypothetical protein